MEKRKGILEKIESLMWCVADINEKEIEEQTRNDNLPCFCKQLRENCVRIIIDVIRTLEEEE